VWLEESARRIASRIASSLLYLFIKDAYIPLVIATQSVNGSGAVTRWGVFNTISLH
jgi:hypothetical protein